MREQEDESRLIEAFTGLRWEAELVKGLLNSAQIDATIKGGVFTAIAPNLSPTVTVLVNEKDYDAAMEIIQEREWEKEQ